MGVLADRFSPFGTTIFTEMTLLAQQHGAVNLAQGFPDFDGPEYVKHAALESIRLGQNQYARMYGVPPLNEAVAGWWREATGVEIDPTAQVTVTSGCTEAIAAALMGLVNPGDEVILFEPYYDSYRASVAMAGGVAKFVTLRAPARDAGGFWFDFDQLSQAFTNRTRAILVNTPHNPTGKVFSRNELEAIAALCIKHGVVAVTDEVYERLTFEPDAPHVRLATLPGMANRTMTLSSLGKSFSLTGWKVGWAVASPELSRAVRAAHQFITFATATPLQHGAAAALAMRDERERAIEDLRGQLEWARVYLADALGRLGFMVHRPQGAYFIMADWTGVEQARAAGWTTDVEFCRGLTAAAGVAAIPPSVFYEHPREGRPMARFAFCKKRETMEEAVRRLERWASLPEARAMVGG